MLGQIEVLAFSIYMQNYRKIKIAYISIRNDKPDNKFLDLIKEFKADYLIIKPTNRFQDLEKKFKSKGLCCEK